MHSLYRARAKERTYSLKLVNIIHSLRERKSFSTKRPLTIREIVAIA